MFNAENIGGLTQQVVSGACLMLKKGWSHSTGGIWSMFKAANRGGLTQQVVSGACLRLNIRVVSLNRW